MSFISIPGNREGFTIIELLIVIAIIAILAAIAIPSYTKYQIRAHDSVLESDSESAYVSAQMYLIENPTGMVDTLAKLKIGGYSTSPGITFSSGNMTIISGKVVIVSSTADDSKNVATLHFNGNIDITPN